MRSIVIVLAIVISQTVMEVFSCTNIFASEGMVFRIGGGYGVINPKEANSAVDTENASATTAGIKGFKLPYPTSILGPTLFAGYRFSPEFELGFAFSSLGVDLSAAGTTGSSQSVSEKISASVTNLVVKPNFYVFQSDRLGVHLSPSCGVSIFSHSDQIVGTSSLGVTAGGTALSLMASIGLEYKFSETFGLDLDLGYAIQRSGNLTVSSVSGSYPATSGSNLQWNGTNAIFDTSGIQGAVQLVIAIPQKKSVERIPLVQDSKVNTDTPSEPNNSRLEDSGREPQSVQESSIENRLRKLKKMRSSGLITDSEYESKKKKLLEEF